MVGLKENIPTRVGKRTEPFFDATVPLPDFMVQVEQIEDQWKPEFLSNEKNIDAEADLAILREYGSGISRTKLAERYNVTPQTIDLVVRRTVGKIRKYLPDNLRRELPVVKQIIFDQRRWGK